MIFKKKFLFLSFILIIILQILLYTHNNQSTSFKYFKWTIDKVSIGKLISFSFFSGLFVSTFLNYTNFDNKKNTSQNIEEDYETVDYEPLDNEKDMKSNIEMPPQRDIRDAQPTISVNYRVVKNVEENNAKNEQNSQKNSYNKDDWINVDNEW